MCWKRSILWIVVAVAIVAGCSRSPQAKEARYLERGKQEFQKKNYAVAIIHFKNAIQAQPRDAEPYYQLGLVYLAGNDFNTAASYFLKATELNPKHTAAQLKVAELMATSQSKEILEEAKKRSQDVLNLLPEDVDALNVLAISELRLGNPQSAEAHLEQALTKAPSHLRSSVALAQTKLLRKDVAGAEAVLKQATAQAPKSPEPNVCLGGFYLALGRTAEAELQFRHALQIDAKYGPALLELAGMQARAGQTDRAEQTYRQVSALPGKQYRPIHALYLFQSGKREQALAEFQKLAKDDPTDRNVRTELVRTYLALNRVSDATNVLTAALQKNPLDADALLQRSRIYLGSQKYAEAEADLNQVLHFRRDSAEAHYLLAKVQLGRGRTAVQQQELGEALRLDPTFLAARVELAQALIGSGGAQSAIQTMDQAPGAQKRAIPLVVQRNWALIALGQISDARKGVDELLKSGKVPDALLQDAILKLNQKNNAASRSLANEVLKQNPGDTRALSVLAQSYSLEKQTDAGLQKVQEYAAQQPSMAPVQQFLGQLLLAKGDRQGARRAFEVAKASDPGLIRADFGLAKLDAHEGKLEEARKRLSAALASHPESLDGRLLLAQLEFSDGKPAVAIEQYRKALALDTSNAMALNNLAYLLAETKQSDEALKYAQRAKQLAPDDPAIDDTLGWTYYQKGLYPMAVTYLQAAVSKQATPRRQYHLAMASLNAGDAAGGRKAFEAALKIDPNLPEAQVARQMFGAGGK
jgi:tetratricopeptide (TPR) repeat protein